METIKTIETKIKQSEFRTWVDLSRFLGYKHSNYSSLKQKLERNIKSLNKALKPLNLEVKFCEIETNKNKKNEKSNLRQPVF